MYKEKINWWWFLLIAGVLLPCLILVGDNGFLLNNVVLYRYFVAGLNLFVGLLFNFFTIAFLVFAFKLNGGWLNKSNYGVIFYLIFGLICITLFLLPYIFDSSEGIPSPARRYLDTSDQFELDDFIFLVSNFLILILFLIFYFSNFPLKTIKNGPQRRPHLWQLVPISNRNFIHFTYRSFSLVTHFSKEGIPHF